MVDTFAIWQIDNPSLFFKSVGRNYNAAEQYLDDILSAAVNNLITSNRLLESVRSHNRKITETDHNEIPDEAIRLLTRPIHLGRNGLIEQINRQSAPKLARLGIQLIDLQFNQLNYSDQILPSVYARMIAERQQYASLFQSEGEAEALEIEGEKEKELLEINSDAYRRMQMIKGEADATAALIYAQTYSLDPEFFSFLGAMDIYTSSLDKATDLMLSTDSEFWKYMKSYR